MLDSDLNYQLKLSFKYSCYDSQVIYELINNFVQHTLYMRSVLPVPYHTLFEEYNNESCLPCSSSSASTTLKEKNIKRKQYKFIEYLESILEEIRSVSRMYPITAAHLLLGPSVNNYKELYSLHFIACDDHGDSAIVDDRLLQKTKRSLIHKLIEVHNNINYDPPVKTNLFVVLSVSIQPTRTLTYGGNINQPIVCIDDDDDKLHCDDTTMYDHGSDEGIPDAPIQLFAFRDSFKIKKVKLSKTMSSCTPKPIHVSVISSDRVVLQPSTTDHDVIDKYIHETASTKKNMDDRSMHELNDSSCSCIAMSPEKTVESVTAIYSSKVLILKKGIKYMA